ncbi:phosphoserine phosphatase SerB [Kordiimonas aestuarii]|uniref:phosphoserine phosphatase SerB n=1 Tax=Kordiimonas aestuarii TaxID=1005925 RepID=UPI0021CFD6B2|nr:phosphoserine phosphatase SerB [Kordiimonas aestuarii]
MHIALTLVVNPGCASPVEKIAGDVKTAIGVSVHETILSEGKAVDLSFDFSTPPRSDSAQKLPISSTVLAHVSGLQEALRVDGLDWCIQQAKGRRKRLILADMDSTMITVECIDELADFVGLKHKVAAITEAAMRGELDFEGALTERVALLKGLPLADLARCYDDRIELMDGARTLVQTMKKIGAQAVLVSGGFTYFTEKVAAAIGFDVHRANVLEFAGDSLSGTVQLPICGAQTKLDTLMEFKGKLGLTSADILAVGDGANDIPMIEAAGLGVAYHAKPKTRDAAAAAVTYGDLTSLLYFQGYHDAEFAAV